MDRYRALALTKLLRSGIDGWRWQAALDTLRRKTAILAQGARKRGREQEALNYELALAEFSLENVHVGSGDLRLRQRTGLSFPDA